MRPNENDDLVANFVIRETPAPAKKIKAEAIASAVLCGFYNDQLSFLWGKAKNENGSQ
ncbi:MAG TPA: hypothetical protein VKH37_00360 [Ferruginibacter sp.]|nr:hypothetical protein [Ferruginibacter sp.]